MTLSDIDIKRLENAIALTLELSEALKRVIYYSQDLETLNHLNEIVSITIRLRTTLIAWRTGRESDDYRQVNQSEMVDRLDQLLDLSDSLWKKLTEIKSIIVSREL